MSRLKAAVVGVGYLGRFHAQKYQALEDTELVAVCDSNEDRANEVASELGVEALTDYKKLADRVDLVTIAASTLAHYELTKFFLTAGVHVHVEKPMTSHVSEAEELCRLAGENGLKLQVGHVERFNSALQSAREKLKDPLFIECHRLAPFKPRGVDVSVVLDLMIHDLDVVLSMVKSDVVSVSAAGTPVMTPHVDIANARIEFADGAIANLTASRVSQKAQRKFRVFQPEQYLSLDFGSGEVTLLTKTGEWKENEELPIEVDQWNMEKTDALLVETQAFVDSVLGKSDVVVTGEDGLTAMQIAEKIISDIDRRLKQKQR